ncbi:MAG: toll/interleukin-1 receptor domain-containing protein [Candidatus Binatia bacterium]
MKVFISWSGDRSKAVANAVRDWLPNVIQSLQPWMSEADIKKGARWLQDIAHELEDTRIGLVCLTPENLAEPWLLFEAGALAKTLEETFVCPYLFDLEPSDIKGPLAQFQSTRAEKEDTRKLVQTINEALPEGALSNDKINAAFDKWWPDLEKILQNIPDPEEKPAVQRDQREMTEEILEIVRGLARQESTERVSETALQTILGALDPGTRAQPRTGIMTGLIGENPYARLRPGRNLRTERDDEPETPPTDVTGGPKST